MYNYDMRLIISLHMICIYEEWQKDKRKKQHLFSYTTHKGDSAFPLFSVKPAPFYLFDSSKDHQTNHYGWFFLPIKV